MYFSWDITKTVLSSVETAEFMRDHSVHGKNRKNKKTGFKNGGAKSMTKVKITNSYVKSGHACPVLSSKWKLFSWSTQELHSWHEHVVRYTSRKTKEGGHVSGALHKSCELIRLSIILTSVVWAGGVRTHNYQTIIYSTVLSRTCFLKQVPAQLVQQTKTQCHLLKLKGHYKAIHEKNDITSHTTNQWLSVILKTVPWKCLCYAKLNNSDVQTHVLFLFLHHYWFPGRLSHSSIPLNLSISCLGWQLLCAVILTHFLHLLFSCC